MKKLLCYFMILWAVVACSSNDPEPAPLPEVEAPRYKIYLQVLDAETGKTLLDPAVLPSLLWWMIDDPGITATCRGETFELSRFDDFYYDPNAPFRLEQYIENYGYRYRIVFDGFTMDKTFGDELIIDWGVNEFTTHMIVIAEVEQNGNELLIERSLTVNGEPVVCEEGEDWHVVISHKVPEIEENLPISLQVFGTWFMTEYEAMLNDSPLTVGKPKEAIYWTHWLMDYYLNYLEDQIRIGIEAVLDGKQYSILIPIIRVAGGGYDEETHKDTFYFNEVIWDGELTIDGEPQTVEKITVSGGMYWDHSKTESLPAITPQHVLPPIHDYFSDLNFLVEYEGGTLELKINYLTPYTAPDWVLIPPTPTL